MALRTLKDLDLKGKKVLVRVDFNVPLKGLEISDDTRISAALPTLRYILEQEGASLVVMSHLGRPKGIPDPAFSLKPAAERLEKLIGRKVHMAPDCVGGQTKKMAENLKAGEILLLENVRFHREETENDREFAKSLSENGDVYVNDAFGSAHRAHASTEGIAAFLPSAAGFLIEKEVRFFQPLLTNPEKPFVAIIGGAKVSTKIGVLESLLKNCDTLIIGGGMCYTFLKALGHTIGKSLCEQEFLDMAKDLLAKAGERGVEVILPSDHIAAEVFAEDAKPVEILSADIPDGMIGMDVGPGTLVSLEEKVRNAKSVIWNGPMGVFEFESFSKGTIEVARMVANCEGVTVVGGGDSVAAVNKFNFADRIDHVSTGGGASLEFLEGKTLPGIAALED